MKAQLAGIALVLAATVASAPPLLAQDLAIRLGQSLQLSREPLEITSDQLEVDQATGATLFSGNVLAIQGDMRLTADRVRLQLIEVDGRQRIDRLDASGGVTMVTTTEAAESTEAVYSLSAQTLEMTGNVILTQGVNTLSGQRLTVDLRTGAGQITGRVRTVISLD